MKVSRRFTKEGRDPYTGINFERRTSEIRNPDGSVIFRQEDVEVPSEWSQIATDILVQKYFRKAGVPQQERRKGGERSARQVFHRLAHTWRLWGERHGYFDSESDAHTFYDELVYMLARQMAAPNSPQWFNTGLHAVYGIEGPPQGHYYVDPQKGEVRPSENAYERPQPHACFIQDVQDDLVGDGGIMDLVSREARLFKYGSGTGSNFSRLRGKKEPLSGGGVSSGLLSFLKVNDRSASAIKSGGTTRRAAKMVILDADHPDIEEYIDWKVTEEHKVASMVTGSKVLKRHADRIYDLAAKGADDEDAGLRGAIALALADEVPPAYVHRVIQLARQGAPLIPLNEYSTEWDDEAYATVSGQTSNNSVRVTNEFMNAIQQDREWELSWRTDPSRKEAVRARRLWERIAVSAWQCADPGLQFHTTINEWHTCPEDGEIRGSNPCSEYMFLDDTACNLASLNLMKFYDSRTGRFRLDDYLHAIRLWTIVLEISVLMAQFPSKVVARRSYDFRTLGLGFANLGSLLMAMGIPYDSDEGRAVGGAMAAILSGQAYAASAEMASHLGPFPRYEANKEHMLRVIRNHRRAAHDAPRSEYDQLGITPVGLDAKSCPEELVACARECWDRAVALGEKHGFRNAQVTAIAPTGTIGLVMDCDTTGIEPDYALVKFKKLAGGGYLKIINQTIPPALRNLGYRQKEIEEVTRYCVGRGTLRGAPGVSYESLREKGVPQEALERVEALLPTSFSLSMAVNPSVLGRDVVTKALGLAEAKELPDLNILARLGYTKEEVEQADRYACGTMTVEGAPHLKQEHYAVFDTANKSGRWGTRFIAWKAHIGMMAAVQPYISGAISKTINMPGDATVEEVKEAYQLSWRRMLKAIALYRDGSKLSQPLSSLAPGSDPLADSILALRDRAPEVTTAKVDPKKPRRQLLPNRRKGYTQKAKIGGHSLFLRTGEYEDGGLGEIFLDMYKEGAAFRSLLHSFAMAVSIGLQYGVPLDEYIDSFTFTRFEPNGVVTGHDNLKMATSVLDFVFRDLAMTYRKRTDLVQVKPDDLISTNTVEKDVGENGAQASHAHVARMKGYEGDPCPSCGHFTLVRNGTCMKCETCGSTTGCS
jgi:ribonucleoside-diphosphate reductase alpha chain